MKKLNVILLIFSFVLSGLGGLFLFGATASNEGFVPTNAPIVEEITEWTYKTYDELLTDLEITKEKMTEKDFTGDGSKDNPYVINSTRGFLYFASYTKNKVSMYYKYIELNCDIILNDETFDEDGNPSGGDGIVYTIDADFNGSSLSIDGKGYAISGWYFNDETKDYVTIFKRNTLVKKAENLIFENIYVAGNAYVSIFHYADELDNCVIRSGNFNGNQNVSTFSQQSIHIRNCKNFANVNYLGSSTNNTSFTGINLNIEDNGSIENTHNYGNVFGYDNNAGITLGGHHNTTIKNCINYGEIHGRAYTGGIISRMYSGDIKILNCRNYGDIYNDAYSAGGLMGYCYADVYVDNFINDADIIAGSNSAGFIGYVANVGTEPSNITITNSSCFLDGNKSVNSHGIFGRIAKTNYVYMKNIKLDIKNNDNRSIPSAINSISEQSVLKLQNALINVESKNKINFYLVHDVTSLTGFIDMSNIYVKVNFDASGVKRVNYCPQKIQFVNNIIIESTVKNSVFYGTDFSGFYFSWRTGKIGLVALEGMGSFQGQITEEFLTNRGYTKKEV